MKAALFNALLRLFVLGLLVAVCFSLLDKGNREGVMLLLGGVAFGAFLVRLDDAS